LSVLLDEAQDTDRTNSICSSKSRVIRTQRGQTEDQTLCNRRRFSAGDLGAAIRSPRLSRVHTEIVEKSNGLVSRLAVTFRCDRAIIDFVNRIFALLLDATEGQAPFVQLSARDDAGPGQVVRWVCPATPASGKKNFHR